MMLNWNKKNWQKVFKGSKDYLIVLYKDSDTCVVAYPYYNKLTHLLFFACHYVLYNESPEIIKYDNGVSLNSVNAFKTTASNSSLIAKTTANYKSPKFKENDSQYLIDFNSILNLFRKYHHYMITTPTKLCNSTMNFNKNYKSVRFNPSKSIDLTPKVNQNVKTNSTKNNKVTHVMKKLTKHTPYGCAYIPLTSHYLKVVDEVTMHVYNSIDKHNKQSDLEPIKNHLINISALLKTSHVQYIRVALGITNRTLHEINDVQHARTDMHADQYQSKVNNLLAIIKANMCDVNTILVGVYQIINDSKNAKK